MKHIVYSYLMAGPAPGVEQKIRDQARTIQELGVEGFSVLVIGPDARLDVAPARFVHRPKRTISSHVDYAFRRFRLLRDVLRREQAELVLLRYPLADPDAPSFAEDLSVVSEHHSKEPEERAAVFGSAVGLPQRAHKALTLTRERRYAHAFLSQCMGIVGVTDEIRRFELERAGAEVPSMVVPNGIAVDRVRHTRFRPFDGRTLNLVFVPGRDSPWHGTDRLLRSLARYRGNVAINCHIAGDVRNTHRAMGLPLNVGVKVWGAIDQRAMNELMATATLAISTLSLHRKGLREAAPLKGREYLARGLPYVLAYEDPDLEGHDKEHSFLLSVPNDESLISVEALIAFAERVSADERDHALSDRMRAYAKAQLDWRPKLSALVQFLRRL